MNDTLVGKGLNPVGPIQSSGGYVKVEPSAAERYIFSFLYLAYNVLLIGVPVVKVNPRPVADFPSVYK